MRATGDDKEIGVGSHFGVIIGVGKFCAKRLE